jgi:hypothetical protein
MDADRVALAQASGKRFNRSAKTDPQLQEAASPQVLRSGCLRRYTE